MIYFTPSTLEFGANKKWEIKQRERDEDKKIEKKFERKRLIRKKGR